MRQDMQVLTSMNTGEWYTPEFYLDLVRGVFGGPIDLDPASDPIANQLVNANRFFTASHDGLASPWHAKNVFLNPPYSVEGQRKAYTSKWIDKALQEYQFGRYRRGIYLVNAKIGYQWFNHILDNVLTTVVLHRDRMGFIDPTTMDAAKPSRQPQATIYVGPDSNVFRSLFGELGWLL